MIRKVLSGLICVLVFATFHIVTCEEDSRIIGGVTATAKYPYQVSIQVYNPVYFFGFLLSNYSHVCGGSILSENIIITAGHCIQPNVTLMTIFAGANNLLDSNGQRRQVLSCLTNPNFVPLGTSDVALCKVSIPFVFGPTVNSIQLNTSPIAAGTNCTLTGWGSTLIFRWLPIPFYNIIAYPMDLKTIGLPVITTTDCNTRFSGVTSVNDLQICTFGGIFKGACAGDSGGPLVCGGKLAGIVSFGTSICAEGYPDVYTNVSSFTSWVNSNMFMRSVLEGSNDFINEIANNLPEGFN